MATTECRVFHGVGAVIARVTSHTKFSVLAIIDDGPNDQLFSATSRLFEVDLEATPNTTAVFSDVRFDDRGVDRLGVALREPPGGVAPPLGITTLGSGMPGDLTRSSFIGAVYVEHDHFQRIESLALAVPDDPHPWPGKFFEMYQVTSVTYSNSAQNGSRAGRRYHGFRGTVLEVAGRQVNVSFQLRRSAPVQGPFLFDLDDPAQCDSDPPSDALAEAPSIAASPIVSGTPGALFVALPHAAALGLRGGKLPIGLED